VSEDTSYCNTCGRKPAKLRQVIHCEPMPHIGIMEPWDMKYYLCSWHQAAETRRKNREKRDDQ
jgi:hypothetical protein